MSKGLAFVFPGQGSQAVGMGKSWAERFEVAKATFAEADEALDLPISRLCWEGPAEELQLTANTQPAILTVSIAIQRVLDQQGVEPILLAGHSLGEYSALVAAGALGFADALRLVRERGERMQAAVPVGDGAMAAILGLDANEVAEVSQLAAEGEVCAVANLNAPGQTVIAGHARAVERAVGLAKGKGARRAMLLPVSAPFHSPLMAPARRGLTPRLENTAFADPHPVVVSNIDAAPVRTGDEARSALERQIDGPVRWVEVVEWMVTQGRTEVFAEVGPGTVLAGLIRRISPGSAAVSVNEPDAIDKLMETLRGKE